MEAPPVVTRSWQAASAAAGSSGSGDPAQNPIATRVILSLDLLNSNESNAMQVGPKAGWILSCLYCSKISMLFIASKSVVWVSAVLLLAVTPPLLLYKDKTKRVSKMKIWQGYSHVGVVALSAWFCLHTIFEALQWLQGRLPSDSLLLGSYVLLTGISCLPIVALHFDPDDTTVAAASAPDARSAADFDPLYRAQQIHTMLGLEDRFKKYYFKNRKLQLTSCCPFYLMLLLSSF